MRCRSALSASSSALLIWDADWAMEWTLPEREIIENEQIVAGAVKAPATKFYIHAQAKALGSLGAGTLLGGDIFGAHGKLINNLLWHQTAR
mmetsp:Transcript_18382/g.29688  ORF Transcript_18382/g.29688 Transcript_18382/m.29688 type:complete len:91 (-) Transcript_18382:1198-1470(-)